MPLETPPRKRSAKVSLLVALAMAAVLMVGALSWAVETIEVPPRVLAQYIERRASGHNPSIVALGRRMADFLWWLERVDPDQELVAAAMPGGFGVPEAAAMVTNTAHGVNVVNVTTVEEAIVAFERAKPGDTITFAPGRYPFTGTALATRAAGTKEAAITVRSAEPGAATLEFDMSEGFRVSEPYWTFENLRIRGTCNRHSDCEHAFHIVGRASHFVARHNEVSDFNAHFKINGDGKSFPDDGLIEGNVLSNTGIRDTDNPVTPIDLVAASRWTIRGNSISDFAKSGSDRVSYGAFAKGGGGGNVFERNLVVCERRVKGAPGQRIGISLGGGGSEKAYCRDTRCITEQDGSTIRSNLVMSCSDDGIYINRSAISRVEHNTLIDTAGISVRFAESSAELEGNLVDGSIKRRDGAALHTTDNIQTSPSRLYVGSHPVRGLFRSLATLQWDAAPPRRTAGTTPAPDLCGLPRPAEPAYGAFEDFSKCLPR
jgi:parallel beta-helix repeat protein